MHFERFDILLAPLSTYNIEQHKLQGSMTDIKNQNRLTAILHVSIKNAEPKRSKYTKSY